MYMANDKLPNELWFKVQKDLGLKDLSSLSCTSRHIRSLVLPSLFKSVTIDGHIAKDPQEMDVARFITHLNNGLPGLQKVVERATCLQRVAGYVRHLTIKDWPVPTAKELQELYDDTSQAHLSALETLHAAYDSIIRAASMFPLQTLEVEYAKITIPFHCGLICKPTLKSISLDACPVEESLYNNLGNFPSPTQCESLEANAVVDFEGFLEPEISMAYYISYLVSVNHRNLHSLSTRIDFLSDIDKDKLSPGFFPRLEHLNILPSSQNWSDDIIYGLLAFSVNLKALVFEPISYYASYGTDWELPVPKDLPKLALTNLTSVTGHPQFIKALTLKGPIKHATLSIFAGDDDGRPLGIEESEIIWMDILLAVVQLSKSTGPLTHFCIQICEETRSYCIEKDIRMPLYLLRQIGPCVSEVVELIVPELNIAEKADIETTEFVQDMLHLLTWFPVLESFVINPDYTYQLEKLKYFTRCKTGTSFLRIPGRIHPTLVNIYLGKSVYCIWEHDSWNMYKEGEHVDMPWLT